MRDRAARTLWAAIMLAMCPLLVGGCRACRVCYHEVLPPAWAMNASPAQVKAAEQFCVPVAREMDFGEGTTMRFLLIPPGEFLMGAGEGWPPDDYDPAPQHRVQITKPFYMSITEVTEDQYEAVMTGTPTLLLSGATPMFGVSWDEAQEFCRKLSEQRGLPGRLAQGPPPIGCAETPDAQEFLTGPTALLGMVVALSEAPSYLPPFL